MKPDVVIQWCVYNDYPIFRRNMNKYRDRVNKVIVYPSRHHGFNDMEKYCKKVFTETWVDPVEINYSEEDWRQAETEPCLEHVESDWIWFSEQDFFVDDWDKFYSDVDKLMETSDMFGWWNPSHYPYIHPCCLFIKRDLLEKTNKDFRAHPEIEGCDHFAMITREAENLGAKIVKLQDIGWKDWENAFHMGGLTYPYQNWGLGDGMGRVFGVAAANPEAFYVYNHWSKKVDGVSKRYVDLTYEIEDYMKRHEGMSSVEPETSKWRKFFV